LDTVKFSDSVLLNGLVLQDKRVVKAFYESFFEGVRRFVLFNNGNEEDAKDLFQDVLMVLFQKARDEHFELTCALKTFVFSVARFLWLKELNKRKWVSRGLVVDEEYVDVDTDISQISEKNERLVVYRRCFDKLSDACRKVLSLFHEGHSIAEITAILGYRSEQHTKNRRYRCKMALINSVRAEYDV
jgi:RNA polymerase sigma factor (sigma-70 family)